LIFRPEEFKRKEESDEEELMLETSDDINNLAAADV